ncbi:hypothetical protein HDF08_002440 [Edaphobacter lichenicola]|uniref:Uncharacterized protein n=1 Tax=Tunturiibacter lichenicola TaxID=2051959 RepID=A0A852VBW7_9BACT|nr:hypothetical protein [Edaphobacter lichenicola]
MIGPAGRAAYAAGGHFVTCITLRVALPMVAVMIVSDHREDISFSGRRR